MVSAVSSSTSFTIYPVDGFLIVKIPVFGFSLMIVKENVSMICADAEHKTLKVIYFPSFHAIIAGSRNLRIRRERT
jgi:hypothetical protein